MLKSILLSVALLAAPSLKLVPGTINNAAAWETYDFYGYEFADCDSTFCYYDSIPKLISGGKYKIDLVLPISLSADGIQASNIPSNKLYDTSKNAVLNINWDEDYINGYDIVTTTFFAPATGYFAIAQNKQYSPIDNYESIKDEFFYLIYNLNMDDFPIFEETETTFFNDVYDPISLEDVLENIKAYDVGDSDYVTVNVDSNDCGDFTTPGSCEIELSATDSHGNTSYLTVIVISQSFKPIITTSTSYIEVSYNKKLTQSELISYFNAYDYAGNSINNFVVTEDNYSINYDKPGTYTFKVSITANTYTVSAQISIKITDIVPPYFLVKNTINVNLMTKLGITDLINISQAKNGASFKSFTVVEDTYSENWDKVGVYKFKANAQLANNNNTQYDYDINVYGSTDNTNINIPNENDHEQTWLDKVVSEPLYIIGGMAGIVLLVAILVSLFKRKGNGSKHNYYRNNSGRSKR